MGYSLSLGEPPTQLRGFQGVTLAPGRSARVTITLGVSAFQSAPRGVLTVVAGTYSVSVGESSASFTSTTPIVW
ncbi:MAG: hypothetical protein HKL87_04780 [Acidimicrobiaceae bacterium]|nr:hypothetical protein [Acidimicrobiaceae bacterium]